MADLSTQKLVPPKDVLIRELAGEAVLLKLDSEMYFGLDDVGFRVWTALTSADRVAEAHQALLAEYAVEPEVLWKSIEAFVAQCSEYGLLNVASNELTS